MTDKTYHLYLFYLRPKYSDYYELPFYDDDTSSSSSLYAYTIDKECDKSFCLERKPECFYRKKAIVTKDELNDLRRRETEKELFILKRMTKFSYHEESFCMTHLEYTMTKSRCDAAIAATIWKYTNTSPIIFKKKYHKALSLIKYSNGYQMLHSTVNTEKTWHYYGNIEADLISAFISEYGWSLKYMK